MTVTGPMSQTTIKRYLQTGVTGHHQARVGKVQLHLSNGGTRADLRHG